MVIELSGVQFGPKSQVWFQTKIARHEVQLPLYYIHFQITQIKDLVRSNILLMQYWAGLKLNSSIFEGGKSKTFVSKSCKICHMILFVSYFPAIWSVTVNKPWNLIGCFVYNVAPSLAGKKMQFRAKNGAKIASIRANQITGTTNDFKMGVVKKCHLSLTVYRCNVMTKKKAKKQQQQHKNKQKGY